MKCHIKLRCFVAMKYDTSWIDPVFDIIEDAASSVDLEVFRSDREGGLAEPLRQKIEKEIDDSLIFVCEGSSFSWFVAFELEYAIKHKPCIILIQDPLPEFVHANEGVCEKLYKDMICITYSLSRKDKRIELKTRLAKEFTKIIDETVECSNQIANKLLCKDKIQVPVKYIDPVIQWGNDKLKPKDVWEYLMEQKTPCAPLAVLSPSGYGKSAFLAMFKHFVSNKKVSKQCTVEDFPNWVLLKELGVMMEMVDNWKSWPSELFQEYGDYFQRPARGESGEAVYPILKSHNLETGMVYLFLDGLDEFGLQRGKDLEPLMKCIKDHRKKGVKVILSCRKWFWEQRISEIYKEVFEVVEIEPLNIEQAREFLANVQLPRPEKGQPGIAEEWCRSPLLLTFLRDSKPDRFQTRTDIYTAWAESITAAEVKHLGYLSSEKVLNFFKELAFLLAKGRTQIVDRKKCEKAEKEMTLQKESHEPYNPLKAPTSKFLESRLTKVEGQEEVWAKFYHPSLSEFFLAKRLEKDYLKAIENSAEQLGLSEVDLDFVAASMYGFLAETLGPEYEGRLVRWLAELRNVKNCPEKLARNLVEYVGMTSQGKDLNVARKLFALVVDENKSLPELIRYNAARAFERVHPSAPKPYFDYTSDWGQTNFGKCLKEFDAWAIRGALRKKRSPGKHLMRIYHYTRNDTEFLNLRQDVSNRLLELLEEAVENNKYSDLQVNCAWALIRWCDFHDSKLDKRIETLLEKPLAEGVMENLKIIQNLMDLETGT